MLISDSKKFIFIHISKTAGTSITETLTPYSLPKPNKAYSLLRIFNLPNDYHQFRFRKHVHLDTLQLKMPADVYQSYLKFAVVRNPWDRFISSYHQYYGIKPGVHRLKTEPLLDYLKKQKQRNNQQLSRINNQQGEIGLDYILRFEQLNDDFSALMKNLEIDANLLHRNSSSRSKTHYQDYYNDESRQYVQNNWTEEIEKLDYYFD